jgi:hypothetical protein
VSSDRWRDYPCKKIEDERELIVKEALGNVVMPIKVVKKLSASLQIKFMI